MRAGFGLLGPSASLHADPARNCRLTRHGHGRRNRRQRPPFRDREAECPRAPHVNLKHAVFPPQRVRLTERRSRPSATTRTPRSTRRCCSWIGRPMHLQAGGQEAEARQGLLGPPAHIRGPRLVQAGREHRGSGRLFLVGPTDIFPESSAPELGIVPASSFPSLMFKVGDTIGSRCR